MQKILQNIVSVFEMKAQNELMENAPLAHQSISFILPAHLILKHTQYDGNIQCENIRTLQLQTILSTPQYACLSPLLSFPASVEQEQNNGKILEIFEEEIIQQTDMPNNLRNYF